VLYCKYIVMAEESSSGESVYTEEELTATEEEEEGDSSWEGIGQHTFLASWRSKIVCSM
jgi:hypothetical protein